MFTKSLFYTDMPVDVSHKIPSTKIKLLTISMPWIQLIIMVLILIYTVISQCDNNWGSLTVNVFTNHVDDHTLTKNVLEIVFIILIAINWILYPLFILENVNNLLAHNPTIRQTLKNPCCKHFYYLILSVIVIQPLLLTSAAILDMFEYCNCASFADYIDDHTYNMMLYGIISFYVVIELLVHIFLISILIKAFHQISVDHYNTREDIDEKSHESHIAMARYSVTFGAYTVIYMTLNLLSIAISRTSWYSSKTSIWSSNSPVILYFAIKEITSIICVYLSFEWNHGIYEIICCAFHRRCMRKIEKFHMRHRNQMLLDNARNMQVIDVVTIQSQNINNNTHLTLFPAQSPSPQQPQINENDDNNDYQAFA